MIILAYITFSILFLVSVLLYSLNTYHTLYKSEVCNNRFVTLPTMLELYQESNDDDELSEDIRKLIGDTSSGGGKIKRITTQTVIDLEEILTMAQWTTSRFDDESIKSDSTMITFRTGDQLLVMENLTTMENCLASYLDLKSMRR